MHSVDSEIEVETSNYHLISVNGLVQMPVHLED